MGGHRRAEKSPAPRRITRPALIAGLALLVVLGLGAGAAVAFPELAARVGLSAQPSAETGPTPPTLLIRPLARDAPAPTATGLSGKLDGLSGAAQLGTLTGVVLDPATGATLWSRAPARALVPGSTGKVLTAAAALLALDPAARMTTRVVAGTGDGEVVLVGGGDPTLSSLPADQDSVYPGAAKLDALAGQVRAAHPGRIRTVTVDVGRYRGAGMAPGWLAEDVAAGYITPIEAAILDGGRGKPAELDTPRTATPGLDAGRALARRLGADPAGVALGDAPATPAAPGAPARAVTAAAPGQVLGEVGSPPIVDLVQTALRISDNVLAETLAREVALARGGEPTFAGGARAVLATLTEAGFDVDGATVADGSGLSTDDRVPARLLGEVMAAAAASQETSTNTPAADRTARLRPLLGGLPVAGGDGTLGARFAEGASEPGRGYVRAKTGTLTGVSSLAGLVTDVDGRLLVFALMSNGASPAGSRPRLDAIAAALRSCGCR